MLGLCVAVILTWRMGQLFFEFAVSDASAASRTASRLTLPAIHAFVPITVGLFTTWYLVACNTKQRRAPSFVVTLLAIAGTTALVGFFYELTFVQEYSRGINLDGSQRCAATGCWEHVLFGMLANVLVSVCAFASIALFFTVRERLPEAERDEQLRAVPERIGTTYQPVAAPPSMSSR